MSEFFTAENFLALWIFIIGLCIGSFLNVVALRGLSGESIVFPASHCPVCKNKLKWWMNIPVFSYLFLRGKCGFCKTDISPLYPAGELFTGLIFLFIYLQYSLSVETLFFMAASSLLTVMSLTDLKESVILDYHAYILIITGFIFNAIANGGDGALFSIWGGVSGFVIYEILARSGYLIAGQRAFGEGDSLIAAGIGAFFGWKMMLVSIALSVFVMAVFTLPYFFIHSYKTGKKKTCAALILAVLLIIFSYVFSKFEIVKTFLGSLIFLFVIIILTFLCAKQILSDMKKRDENGGNTFCMLPFGPSMAISFLLIMFFSKQLTTFIRAYFG
ncbi:MAG: prepilin peptidase [bacterium]|nr:prepilin peptidase [bacterium]